MEKWWTHQNDLPKLDADEKQRVEDITGSIPLLLHSLIGLGKNFKDVEPTFLNAPELQAVTRNVALYMQSYYNMNNMNRWNR